MPVLADPSHVGAPEQWGEAAAGLCARDSLQSHAWRKLVVVDPGS